MVENMMVTMKKRVREVFNIGYIISFKINKNEIKKNNGI